MKHVTSILSCLIVASSPFLLSSCFYPEAKPNSKSNARSIKQESSLPPSRLFFRVAPQTMPASSCKLVLVESQDSARVVVAPTSDAIIRFTSNDPNGVFFGDAGCTVAIGSLSLPKGYSSRSAYIRLKRSGDTTLGAEANFGSGNASVRVTSTTATKINLRVPTSFKAGVCSAALVTDFTDASGNATTFFNGATLALSATNGQFYSDAGCSSQITNLSVSNTELSKTFYYLGTVAATVTVGVAHASSSAVTPASTQITVGPGVPVALKLTAPAAINVSTCGSGFLVSVVDAFNNLSPPGTAFTANLLVDAVKGGLVRPYSDSGCANAITGFSFAATDTSKIFYLRAANPQAITLIANASNGAFADVSTVVRIRPASGALLTIGLRNEDIFFPGFVGTSYDRTLVVTNSGTSAATGIFSAPMVTGRLDYKNGSYPGLGGTCGTQLAANSTCTIVITAVFNQDLSQVPATIDLTYNGTSHGTLNLGLIPLPTPNYLRFSVEAAYSYLPMYNGATAANKVVTITNNSSDTLTNLSGSTNSPFGFSGGSYPGIGGDCGNTLAPNANCKVVVFFSPPTSLLSLYLTSVNFSFNQGASSYTESFLVFGAGNP